MSNVLNDKQDLLELAVDKAPLTHHTKLHLIYNESNFDAFTDFDPSKIYLVFTKINETQYLARIQSARSG